METVPDEVKKPLVQVDQPAPVEIPPAPVQQPASEPILKDGEKLTDWQTGKPLSEVVTPPAMDVPQQQQIPENPVISDPVEQDPGR